MSYGSNFSNANFLDATFAATKELPLTLVAWIKRSGAQWEDTGQHRIIALGDDTADALSYITMHAPATDTVVARAYDATSGNGASSNAFTANLYDDIWVPVIARYTSSASREVFIGDSSNSGGESTSTEVTTLLDELRIGRQIDTGNAYNGLVAEVAIFDKALSDAEIDALQYGPGHGPPPWAVAPANCLVYWSLNTDQATHTDEGPNSGPTLSEQGSISFDSDHPDIGGAVYVNDAATKDGGEVLQAYPGAANWSDTSIDMQTVIDTTGLTAPLFVGVETAEGAITWRAITVSLGEIISVAMGPIR